MARSVPVRVCVHKELILLEESASVLLIIYVMEEEEEETPTGSDITAPPLVSISP